MRDFLVWMQASTLGVSIRASGVWTYAVINLCHILGVATLFGSVLILDLRLLGLWGRVPIRALSTVAVPLARAGFAVAATTGIGLLSTNATEYIGNPMLFIKFPAIALGLLNVLLLSRLPAWRAHRERDLSLREHRQLALMGGISLASWLTAVTAGRMIAYW